MFTDLNRVGTVPGNFAASLTTESHLRLRGLHAEIRKLKQRS